MLTPEGGPGAAEGRSAHPGGRGQGLQKAGVLTPEGRAGGCREDASSPWRAGPGAAESRGAHPRGQGRGCREDGCSPQRAGRGLQRAGVITENTCFTSESPFCGNDGNEEITIVLILS